MKVLIAGLGSIGRRHLRNLLALGEREILLYRTGKASLPDAELDGFPVETDLQKALDWNPQAVIVSNPTALHLDVAVPAAWRGCRILLEKPVSHSLDGVDELERAAGEGGGVVLVGYQFRFHPGLRKVRQLLDEGAIGKPVYGRAHWGEYLPAWHPWEDYRSGYSARQDLGGGVTLTLSHTIDILGWMLGKAESCWGLAGNSGLLDLQGVEDTIEIGVSYRSDALGSGVLGSIHMDYLQRPPSHTLAITGSEGRLEWDNTSGQVRWCREGEGWQVFSPPEGFERNDLFLAEMQHFLEVARGEASPLCTLDDGIEALRVALAGLESSRTGRLQSLL